MLIKCQLLCCPSIIMKVALVWPFGREGDLVQSPRVTLAWEFSTPAPSPWLWPCTLASISAEAPPAWPGLWSHQEIDTGCLSSTSLIVWMLVLPPRPCSSEQCGYSRAWLRGTFIMETAFIRTSRGTRDEEQSKQACFIPGVPPASSPSCCCSQPTFAQGSLCARHCPKSFTSISSQQSDEAAIMGSNLLSILQGRQPRRSMVGACPSSLR